MTRLVAEDVSVSFGGLLAVSGVSLEANPERITGLIGPNGAGKTTTFNALTGTVVASGVVRLDEQRIDSWSTRARANAGLGRTFQRMELFDTMTARENVAMGAEMVQAGPSLRRHLVARSRERSEVRDRADDAIARCGLVGIADRLAVELSTGQRRMVELARAIASQFGVLLLDEPSSGLDGGETEAFGSILRQLADDGTTLLLVEHDMALVRSICDYLYVLDFGKLLVEGPAAEVLADELVRNVYLGSELEAAEA